MFGWVEADLAQRVSRSARRCSAGSVRPPKRSRPHSAIGCSGVFCRSCEALHSTQVCGVSAEPRMELLDEPRLAEAGLADDQDKLALAGADAVPAARSSVPMSSSRPTKGVSARAPPLRPPPLARTTAIERQGLGDALQLVRALAPRRRRARPPGAARFP